MTNLQKRLGIGKIYWKISCCNLICEKIIIYRKCSIHPHPINCFVLFFCNSTCFLYLNFHSTKAYLKKKFLESNSQLNILKSWTCIYIWSSKKCCVLAHAASYTREKSGSCLFTGLNSTIYMDIHIFINSLFVNATLKFFSNILLGFMRSWV